MRSGIMVRGLKGSAGFVLLAIVGLGTSAKASVIPTFTGNNPVSWDTDVLNTGAGNTVLAYTLYTGSGGPFVVNGVSFSHTATQNGVTLSVGGSPASATNNTNPSGAPLSTNLFNVLRYGDYKNPTNSFTVSLSGLTDGTQYQLQLFAGSSFASGTEVVDTTGSLSTGSGGGSTLAYYTVSTFTADSSGSAVVTLASGASAPALFNAVNLQTVPEPASIGLLGLGGLLTLRRRRREA